MRKNRIINIKTDVKILGALNNTQTLFLSEVNNEKMIVKKISLAQDYVKLRQVQETMMKKLYGSSQPLISKPQFYDFENDKSLHLVSPIYHLSLQSILMHHKYQNQPLSPTLVYTLLYKIYDMLNRVKNSGTDFYHTNLKPSNIFCNFNENDLECHVTQCGLLTNFPNKYYARPITNISNMKGNKSNVSFSKDNFEGDLYSLGVIALEMITLLPVQNIYNNLIQEKSIESLENIREARNNYGQALLDFIKQLLRPRENIKEIYHKFKDDPPDFIKSPDYTGISWNAQKLSSIINENIYKETIDQFKKHIDSKQEINCETVMKYAEKFDTELEFSFNEYEHMKLFLAEYEIDLDYQKLRELCFFLKVNGSMNYMEILKYVLPPKDVIEYVMKKAIENYNSKKEFFQANTGGREFWKAEDIHKFMKNLGVSLLEKDVAQVVREWSGINKRTSVKIEQFNKVFKGVGKQAATMRSQKTQRSQGSEKTLKDILIELEDKIPQNNLVQFFRSFDLKGRWVVGPQIDKEIKKFLQINDKLYKELCEQMWQAAGIFGQKDKVLQYVSLLKLKKVYEPMNLFKMVLCEKINETNREAFYQKYSKDDKGWTFHSLIDFNEDEQLDFDQRELKMLYTDLDKDHSGYLSEKQLIFQLTGLKEYDQEFLVQKIKNQASGKWDLFHLFLQNDRNRDLYLDTPGDIANVFAEMEIQIPINHYQNIFDSFKRSDKFQYMVFLRFFIELPTLFIKAATFIIDEFYNGKFDKFFDVGLSGGRRKWNRQSLVSINQELVLGFSNNEIGIIWDDFDKLKDGSLTKAEIAKIFRCECEEEEAEGSLLKLDSVEKFYPGGKDEKIDRSLKNQKQAQKQTIVSDKSKKNQTILDSNETLRRIRDKGLEFCAQAFAQSSRRSGSLSFDSFCKVLEDLKISFTRNLALRNTSNFQFQDPSTSSPSTHINYISMLMFICQVDLDEQEEERNLSNEAQSKQQQKKMKVLMAVIKEIMRNKNISTQDVFNGCKDKSKMKLNDYEKFVKEVLEVEVYFDDIQDTWKFIGEPDYLNKEDFGNLLGNKMERLNDHRPPKLDKQFSFAPQQQNAEDRSIRSSQNERKQSTQSPYFPKNIRKSSNDSRQDLNNNKNKNDFKLKLQEAADEREKNRKQQKQKDEKSMPPKPHKRANSSLEEKVLFKDEEERKHIEEFNRREEREREKQSMRKEKVVTKAEVMEKFLNKLENKGTEPFNILFSKNNAVATQQFITFMQDEYDFTSEQAIKLGEEMNTFGRVKMQTLKKYLKKQQEKQSSPKADQKSKQKKAHWKKELTEEKKGRKVTETSPMKQTKDLSGYKLIDPRKMKINVPMVKEHIRILMSSFSKRFDIHEIEPFFFSGNAQINQDQFIKKCQQINPSISVNMYEKIFLYLKPKMGFISSVSFKLNFSFDQEVQYDESYLPEDLEEEIKNSFERADKDKSGFIEIEQIQHLLSDLGLNETQKEIEIYFEKIDQNYDKKISFKEFKIFIQDNIFPYLNDFDEEVDSLLEILQMNDVFRTGCVSSSIMGGIMERYGVKLNDHDVNNLNRFLANQNGDISIKEFLQCLRYPSQHNFPASLKSVLYKIRWKKKVTFEEIQKIFKNISKCFVASYVSSITKKKILTPSTFMTPMLHESRFYYRDYFYKNMNKIDEKGANLVSEPRPTDLFIELRLLEATGLPIPQNMEIKRSILKRSVSVIFFDTSKSQGRDCLLHLDVQYDPDVEDLWNFNKNNKDLFVKIAQFDPRKHENLLLLFQFQITLVDKDKAIDISCGSCSFPVSQLLGLDSKTTRKYKLIGGIPNKSKNIDRMSVSKRKGLRSLFGGGEMDSELQIQFIPSGKFMEKLPMLSTLPEKSIITRKSIHLFWTFREYFAFKSTDGKRINPDFGKSFLVKTFLLALDIPDVNEILIPFWKQKIEPKVSSNIFDSRRVFQVLLQQLFLIIHSKQFQLLPSFPSKCSLSNKGLNSTRKKLISEVFLNIENWLSEGISKEYKRKKNYGCEQTSFRIDEQEADYSSLGMIQGLIKIKS